MKNKTKIIIILSLILSYITQAQVTESFESYTLTPNFFYQDNNGTDWRPSTTKPMTFEYAGKITHGLPVLFIQIFKTL